MTNFQVLAKKKKKKKQPNKHRDAIRSCRIINFSKVVSMEFRVFFPVLQPNEVVAVAEVSTELARYIETLQSLRNVVSTPTEENRTDDYFVCTSNYGIKYRAGNKIELKVRRKDSTHLGLEHWEKIKLGKKTPEHYAQDMMDFVRRGGHDDISINFLREQLLSPPVAVSKCRRREYESNALLCEITEVKTAVDVSMPTTGGTNSFCSAGTRNHWLSFCLEGPLDKLSEAILTEPKFLLVRVLLRQLDVLLSDPVTAAQLIPLGVVPIISGYPLWLRAVSGLISDDELKHEVLDTLHNLSTHARFSL